MPWTLRWCCALAAAGLSSAAPPLLWPVPAYDLQGTAHADAPGPSSGDSIVTRVLGDDLWWALGSPTFSSSTLYVQLFNGTLCALDAASAAVLWSVNLQTTSGTSASLASDGSILASDFLGNVYRFAPSGALLFRVRGSECRIASDLVASGGSVFFVDRCGVVRALQLSDGAPLWSRSFCSDPRVTTPCFYVGLYRPTLAMADGSACSADEGCDTVFASPDATSAPAAIIMAIDAATGVPRWNRTWVNAEGVGSGIFSPLAIAGGRVMAVDGTRAFAISAATGAPLWSVLPGGGYRRMLGYAPVASRAGDVVFVPIPGAGVFCLNASTGGTLWVSGVAVTPAASALDSAGTLFVLDVNEAVHALNATSGVELWQAPTKDEGETSSGLAIGPGGTLAVLTGEPSQIFVIGAPPPVPPPAPGGDAGWGAAATAGAVGAGLAAVALAGAFAWRGRGGACCLVSGRAQRKTAPVHAREMSTSTDDLAALLLFEPRVGDTGFALAGGTGVRVAVAPRGEWAAASGAAPAERSSSSEASWEKRLPNPTSGGGFHTASRLWASASAGSTSGGIVVPPVDLLDGDSFVMNGLFAAEDEDAYGRALARSSAASIQ